MFKYHINAFEAVKKVRDKRKGAIQNNQQMKFCLRFFQCKILFFFDFFFFQFFQFFFLIFLNFLNSEFFFEVFFVFFKKKKISIC